MTKLSVALLVVFGLSVLVSLIWVIIRLGIGEIIFDLLEAIVEIFFESGD